MRAIEVNMDQRRNWGGGWETGDSRDNPLNNGIDPVTRPGIEPGSPWWEASVLSTQPSWLQGARIGRGKREIPEKTRRTAASSCTIPPCENSGATPPGIEPGSPWWKAISLTTTPPRLPTLRIRVYSDVCQNCYMSLTLEHPASPGGREGQSNDIRCGKSSERSPNQKFSNSSLRGVGEKGRLRVDSEGVGWREEGTNCQKQTDKTQAILLAGAHSQFAALSVMTNNLFTPRRGRGAEGKLNFAARGKISLREVKKRGKEEQENLLLSLCTTYKSASRRELE
ncbi:hypothetical protein PR048_017857 [Dryococelus australis]|uniref:Uncharacterized protein n=1 Tax=Dryococelus australis TaxID=614101 RepID=A0ABQ9HAZ9_9NEOP|nr:hypothetical protein PR048_017857 [Dryococelus australis]